MADFCIVYVIEGTEIRRCKIVSRDSNLEWICDELGKTSFDTTGRHPVNLVFETKQSVLIERVSPEMVESFSS